jgi:hypothetical protein
MMLKMFILFHSTRRMSRDVQAHRVSAISSIVAYRHRLYPQ